MLKKGKENCFAVCHIDGDLYLKLSKVRMVCGILAVGGCATFNFAIIWAIRRLCGGCGEKGGRNHGGSHCDTFAHRP